MGNKAKLDLEAIVTMKHQKAWIGEAIVTMKHEKPWIDGFLGPIGLTRLYVPTASLGLTNHVSICHTWDIQSLG